MRTLGIDTANSVCAVALWADGVLLASVADRQPRGQAERLLPMIAEVLARGGLDHDAIDRYAVNVGPGAFTGLRVGLAAARGLALARSRPLVGVSALEATARAALVASRGAPRPVLVVLDSRREDVYAQAFDVVGRALTAPAAVMPGDLAALAARAFAGGQEALWLGDGLGHVPVPPSPPAAPLLADADVATALARLAATLPESDLAAYTPDPLYIRPPDVTLAPASRP